MSSDEAAKKGNRRWDKLRRLGSEKGERSEQLFTLYYPDRLMQDDLSCASSFTTAIGQGKRQDTV